MCLIGIGLLHRFLAMESVVPLENQVEIATNIQDTEDSLLLVLV